MANMHSDIAVTNLSESLSGQHLDVIVSGSIGAIESVRLIRALRRLGATVTPWLTEGGAQFITPMALAWAAGNPTITQFQGHASHVETHDGCVIAPASANFISRMIHGRTETPSAAIVTSYLGAGKPVSALPSMHDSLAQAPAVRTNLETLKTWGVRLLEPRLEEGKHKMPLPEILADEISHFQNTFQKERVHRVMITLGGTKSQIDDVRYLGNYSTGSLGSKIAEECYRWGFATSIIAGTRQTQPKVYTDFTSAETYDEMKNACLTTAKDNISAAIMCAAVLDFQPKARIYGKVKSTSVADPIELEPTPKIIEHIAPKPQIFVTFKLESEISEDACKSIASAYQHRVGSTMVVLNGVKEVSATKHLAYLVDCKNDHKVIKIEGKYEISKEIVRHLRTNLP